MPEAAIAGPNAAILLRGALESGTVVTAAATVFDRVWIGGATNVEVVAFVSAISATATSKINLYLLAPPARLSGEEGARQSAIAASATLTNNVETRISAAPKGVQFVEVEIAPGASTSVTLGKIMLYTGTA